MNMNEEMNAAFTANPKKFLNADTLSFGEPQACGPPLFECGFNWMNPSSQGQRT